MSSYRVNHRSLSLRGHVLNGRGFGWYLYALQNDGAFDGQVPRVEYWTFTLVNIAVFVPVFQSGR